MITLEVEPGVSRNAELWITDLPPPANPDHDKNQTNHSWSLFSQYSDRIVKAISTNEVILSEFVSKLRTERLISLAEKKTAERQSNVTIKNNMVMEALGKLIKTGRNSERMLKKILLILKTWDEALFEEMSSEMVTKMMQCYYTLFYVYNWIGTRTIPS